MRISMTSTTKDIPGYPIARSPDIVRGMTVGSRGLPGQFVASFRSTVGGKMHEYVVVSEEAREEAFDLTVQHGREKGANAVIGVHCDATAMAESMTEVLAYGTPVVVERA
jgi:uncharacterized protein YbjQ (UPF0145 family)